MIDDAQRALNDYDNMGDAYADDADTDPMKVSYERPAVITMAGDLAGKRVLDVGCATGALSAALVARGASVVGIDLNERLIARARARLGDAAEFHVADISQPLQFAATASFDIVTASLVLHYLADWRTLLGEFHRVLRPGGLLLVSTHHPLVDIDIEDPPAPYFETTLLTDTWRKAGPPPSEAGGWRGTLWPFSIRPFANAACAFQRTALSSV